MVLRPVRISQPQGPARVDWSNPITRGLVGGYQGGGPDVSIFGRPLIVGATSSWKSVSPTPKSNGLGKEFPWTNDVTRFAHQDISSTSVSEFSMFWFGVIGTSTNVTDFTDLMSLGNGASDIVMEMPNNGVSPGSARLYSIGAYAGSSVEGGISIKSSLPVSICISGSASRNRSAVYIDGKTDASSTWTSTGTANRLTLNNRTVVAGTRAGGGRCFVAIVFNRALSDAEIKSLSDNPWQIFAPDSKSLWVPETISAGGGATVIPIGVQATGSVGTPSVTGAANALPAGVSATASVGAPTATGGSSIAATALPAGVSASSAVGTPAAIGAAVVQPVGVSTVSAVGVPVAIAGTSIPATVLPTGVQAFGAVGTPTVTAAAIAQPLGVAAIAYVGTPTIATGVSGVAVAYPAGVLAIGQVGALIATGAAWTAAVGVQAVGSVGTPSAYAGELVIYTPGAQTRPSRMQSSSRPSRLQSGTRASR